MGAGYPRVRKIPATRDVLVILAVLSLFIALSPVAATVFTYPVNASTNSLQGLINSAENGDTVLLQGGNYYENLVINRSIVLRALDKDYPPTIISGDGIAGISLNANDIVVDGITITGSAQYGLLVQSDNNQVHNSSVMGLKRGIGLQSAVHNEISHNTIVNNSVGLYADRGSQMNKVFLNYFDNPVNVMGLSADLLWDTFPSEYLYSGKEHTGSLGNFWKQYQGEDANSDGVGDVPYIVQNTGSGTFGNFQIPDTGDDVSNGTIRNVPSMVQNAGPGAPGSLMKSASITDNAPLMKPPGLYTIIMMADSPVSGPPGIQPSNNDPFSPGPGTSLGPPPPFPANLGPVWWIIPIIIVLSVVAGIWYERTWWRKRHGRDEQVDWTQSRNITVVNKTGYPGNGETGPLDHRHYAARLPPPLEEKYPEAEYLGEGGVGRVFRAKDAEGRTVAIKVPIRFDEVTGSHFTKELHLWQGLHHKNIVEIYSANVFPVPYIEIECYSASLAEIPLPLDQKRSVEIITGLAEGLQYAHEKGIIHRDIKPENILMSDEGVPKITDWGLAKALTDTKQTALISFSPDFAAPEQLAPNLYGDTGPWTDIYQLGVLFYSLMVGHAPFRGEGIAGVMHAILYDDPVLQPLPGTDGMIIQGIIQKCMEKKPGDRYSSVAEIITELKKISGTDLSG
ncbi:MAG: protein kinase [Methanomicrobiales archaeon]